MESVSFILLLVYFFTVIVDMVFGSMFLTELKASKNDLWVSWDRPKSVFSPKKETWELYKYVFFTRREEFGKEVKLYRLSKLFALTTVLSQVAFTGFILTMTGSGLAFCL